MTDDYAKTLEFLRQQTHMVVAVTLADSTPWATPVKIQAWNGSRELDWDSMMSTEHSKAIEANPNVSIAMYSRDTDPFGQFGVYLKGKAVIASWNEKGMARYKFTAEHVWVNDASFRKREVSL